MTKNGQLSLTEGPILKTLSRLALPIMASSFLGTAYSITDMAWIGVLGAKAVAGVGVGGMYVWLSQGLVSLARMGGQVHVAQCCGSGDRKSAANYAAGAIQLTCVFGLLFAAVCLLFTDPLLSFFQLNDPVTYGYGKVYMQITCGLILFSFMNITLTGLLTAQGDSKTPLKANLAGLVTNMILDPVLILGIGPFPRIEVAGAAIATVTAQLLVMLVMVASIFRSDRQQNVIRNVKILRPVPGGYYVSICKMGGPTALQGTIYCMISMVLTRMVSAFGAGAVATQRVGGQIESISWNTADGFGAALNAFVGQNYGARKNDRVRKGYGLSLRILILWGILVTALFVLLPRPIAGLFFHEEDVIATAIDYLVVIGIGEGFMCVELMTVGALSGLGRTKLCSIISILLTGSRIPLALLLTHTGLGLNGVWWALTISSVVKGIVFYFAFKKVSSRLE
ncbi:MAG TPA: MATE family efflux transporter [Candidatus Blautia faecigallinarum]|uniref:Probable multidrug resistance protein NorM n=1 Tax=Candidatus Blautia faecigallinarum TaxID=2838488 RepID=A0A9D2ITC6_9FIRM|nr:MATE family efflux transporter [Candidatus Blautia faecigallinarum]